MKGFVVGPGGEAVIYPMMFTQWPTEVFSALSFARSKRTSTTALTSDVFGKLWSRISSADAVE